MTRPVVVSGPLPQLNPDAARILLGILRDAGVVAGGDAVSAPRPPGADVVHVEFDQRRAAS